MTEAEIRELLELAAKAVGYTTEHPWNAARKRFVDPPLYDLVVCKNGVMVSSGWNPWDYDGDSRRLEVALCIEIEHNNPLDIDRYVKAYRYGVVSLFDPVSVIEEFDDESKRLEATRLAVLRAAAAIGRAMP